MRKFITSLRSVRWRGSIILVAGLIALTSVFQTRAGQAVLRTAGLSREATGYTSLSFLHPQSLPEQLTPGQANVATAFTIHNVTSAVHDYRWSVSLVYSGQTRRVHAGSVRLAPGRRAEITRSIAITCTQGLARIIVSLESPAESIDSWMAC
jgi:hypothetical protein